MELDRTNKENDEKLTPADVGKKCIIERKEGKTSKKGNKCTLLYLKMPDGKTKTKFMSFSDAKEIRSAKENLFSVELEKNESGQYFLVLKAAVTPLSPSSPTPIQPPNGIEAFL